MAARGAGLTSASVRSPRRYFALLAKHTGIDFLATKLVLMIHGPLRWARTSNGQPLDSLEDAVRAADYISINMPYIKGVTHHIISDDGPIKEIVCVCDFQ